MYMTGYADSYAKSSNHARTHSPALSSSLLHSLNPTNPLPHLPSPPPSNTILELDH